MFINHTNHISSKWSDAQRREAEFYGEIIDMPFPSIEPEMSESEVRNLAEQKAEEIAAMNPNAVLCQGEYTYTFILIQALKSKGVRTLTACSKRVSREVKDENQNTRKESTFEFVRFREY